MVLNSEFEADRSIKYSCLCDSNPEDCLCQDVQITVTLYCKMTQWLQDNKHYIANPEQFDLDWSEVPEFSQKEKLRTVTYSKVTQKLKKFL